MATKRNVHGQEQLFDPNTGKWTSKVVSKRDTDVEPDKESQDKKETSKHFVSFGRAQEKQPVAQLGTDNLKDAKGTAVHEDKQDNSERDGEVLKEMKVSPIQLGTDNLKIEIKIARSEPDAKE